MKILAVTNCQECCKKNFGFYKLINSWKYFHPNIEIVNWDDKETERIKRDYKNFDLLSFMPIVMLEAKQRYNADLVIKIDSDSIILDKLTEIIDCNDSTQIFSVRNDGDHIGNKDEKRNRPPTIRDIPNEKYLNCGLIATNSEQFLKEWYKYNKNLIEKYGNIENAREVCPMVEQGSYNIIAASGKYKVKILDELGNSLLYGASANCPSAGNHSCPQSIIDEYGGQCNPWASWKDIEYKNGKFMLYGKIVKILHSSGGGSINCKKLSWDRFNEKLIPILKKITNEN
jgi:hypothetical protein